MLNYLGYDGQNTKQKIHFWKVIKILIAFNFSCQERTCQNINLKINLKQTNAAKLNRKCQSTQFASLRRKSALAFNSNNVSEL